MCAHILDLHSMFLKSGNKKFSNFLDINAQNLIISLLRENKIYDYRFDGGYEDAERRICVFADSDADLPICTIFIATPDDVCHRDILGSLMSLGIKRDVLGDIVKVHGGFYIFARDGICDFIISELKKIKRYNIKCEYKDFDSSEIICEVKEILATVLTPRFDSILAKALNTSRSVVKEYIEKGECYVNNVCIKRTDYILFEYDKFSARGHGKFELIEIGNKSKKQRFFIKINKFL